MKVLEAFFDKKLLSTSIEPARSLVSNPPWAPFKVGSKDLVFSQKEVSHIAAEFMKIHSELTIL